MSSNNQQVDRFDKLDGENYRTWKFNMKMALIQRELWEHVNGTVIKPEDTDAKTQETYKRKEEKALATIALGVEPEQQIHIIDCEKASDAWSTLEKVFEPKSRPRILQLKKQMVLTKLEPEESMMSYLTRLKTCSDSLKEAGHEVKDEDLAYAMLCGLPENYEGIIMALANLDDEKFKSTEIKSILLSEYERRTTKEPSASNTQKEAFHQASKLRYRHQEEDTKVEERKCFNCGKHGHIAKYCRNKARNGQSSFKRRNSSRGNSKNKEAFVVELNNTQIDDVWLIDSGATHHICKNRGWFVKYKPIESELIYSASKDVQSNLTAVGLGDIEVETYVNNNKFTITLQNVYHVPNARRNLLSVFQIEYKKKRVIINDQKLEIQSNITNKIVGEAYCKNGLYVFNAKVLKNKNVEINLAKPKVNDSDKWHQRFCHVNVKNIQELSKRNLVIGLENVNLENVHCKGCSIGKSVKTSCKRVGAWQTKTVLELIHSDLCGPMPVKSIGGSEYFLTLTDDYSRKTTVYCLKHKYEVVNYVRKYIARVERETEKKVKRVRTDNGLEFCNKEMKSLFDELGIKHERSNAYTPQMNGVAERINKTLMNNVRAMLKTAKLPEKFWAEALLTACYIKNRVIHSTTDKVPESVWTGNKPSVKHLKMYGCLAYVHISKPGRTKLESRAREGILVGYSSLTKGYRIWDPVKKDITHSKHVEFVEGINGYEHIYEKKICQMPEEDHNCEENYDTADTGEHDKHESQTDNDDDITTEEKGENRRIMTRSTSKLAVTPTGSTTPDNECSGKIIRNPWGRTGKPKNIEINLTEIVEPTTFEQALSSPQSEEWKIAMDEEMTNLVKRNTWEMVDENDKMKYIGSRWVYKVKTDSDGKVARYKARVVAQGYGQKKDIDYFESYAPVTNISTIRLLLSMAINKGWKVHHLDIKCAYLYGEMSEIIYMKLPPGYETDGKIAKLKRPIYGLKQAGRYWNNALDKFLTKSKFWRIKSNNCIYIYGNEIILTIYVDDIIIFGGNENKINRVKDLLKSEYEIRDLGIASYLLGITLKCNNESIKLSQKTYIQKLLNEYKLTECKTTKIPIEPGLKLTKQDCPSNEYEKEQMKIIPYRSLIGSLMYVALATRPDIMYAVSKLSQFVSTPNKIHWMQAKRVLKYLSTTIDLELTYTPGNNEIEIFSDADWAADVDDRRSYSGLIVFLAGNAITWKSNKQKSIATSTMEAEYIALENAVKEAIWMSMMHDELKNIMQINAPAKPYAIRCDNKSAISFTTNRIERSRSKHIDIAYHITREKYEEGLIKLTYVASSDNVADTFTKALPYSVLINHITKMKLL